ncbi:MAG: hypothetical protein A3J62_04180 [Candidatus Buchananbacteria bacterium RIFCSPHIGHO2_02_FULL_38_8]|uniref:Heat-inducible transcription repressor HrcA C-terminal domain-containing protein n=1 Tax=Candidatus Buchananbacteria bacterium RIFCSPHIGHO2_02_FULL_38_8 TaxID=1797538 RepID=A0A1G1Y5H8_9BACT|nr:hypothetical protein [uncultured bacterium]OGY47572.1 MAG: hypothetical protein A3J62_04180 [Candidatus Buchananbacteria bacterium RIFCSPHIGHO2_02_FULL_38_8]
MDQRQQDLLNIIVNQYTKTAQPVGSKLIAEISDFNLSPATIRNDMAELETGGYIFQPHTSAGRVPTEKGYQFYVSNFLKDLELSKKRQQFLAKIIKPFGKYQPELMKNLARGIADLSAGTVFIGFAKNNVYYTGLSNLFAQPEFAQHDLVRNLSQIIDHLDQTIEDIFSQLVSNEVKILIGRQNPFGRDCSSILAKYKISNQPGLIGVLGPIRMDYQNNFSLIKYTQDLINKF